MPRMDFNGRRLPALRVFNVRVGLWGVAMVALAGCGSSSSGDGLQKSPKGEAGAQFSDATVGGDGGTEVAPGQGPDGGAASDGGVGVASDGGADTGTATLDGGVASGDGAVSSFAADAGPVTCAS